VQAPLAGIGVAQANLKRFFYCQDIGYSLALIGFYRRDGAMGGGGSSFVSVVIDGVRLVVRK